MPGGKNTIKAILFILMLLVASGSVYAGTDLNQAVDSLAKKLTSSLKAEVLQANDNEVYINLGQNQGVLPGNRFEVIRQGEPLMVGTEIVGYQETSIALVEVSKSRENVSICKILEKSELPKTGDKAYQLTKQIKRLAIGQFSYNQSFNHFTKSLQDKLNTTMIDKGIQVIERDQLERVLAEQKLGYSGLINIDSAKKIGKLLGAEDILLGSVNDMGNSIVINARLVEIESGNTIAAGESELPKTPIYAQLLDTPLEEIYSTAPPSSGTNSSQTRSTKEMPYFENNLFRIDVISFQRVGGGVELKLKYLNKTKEDISMGLMRPEQNTYIVNDLGNQLPYSESEMTHHQSLTFPAGIPRVSVITFKDTNEPGNDFIATAKYYHSINESFFASFKELALK